MDSWLAKNRSQYRNGCNANQYPGAMFTGAYKPRANQWWSVPIILN